MISNRFLRETQKPTNISIVDGSKPGSGPWLTAFRNAALFFLRRSILRSPLGKRIYLGYFLDVF
jgi:hypothetical protein